MTFKKTKVLLIGFGMVGQGFFELFDEKRKLLGLEEVTISEVVDAKYGYIQNPGSHTIQDIKLGRAYQQREVLSVIEGSDADIVCEFTWLNLKTAEPAYSHIKSALSRGKHVITTNKGPAALKYSELKALAEEKGVKFKMKGTVMSGTPSFNILDLLPGVEVRSVRGIVNGTTNYMLNSMSRGNSFNEALRDAQVLGYAEADPINDIDGYDAAAKIIIISNILGWNHSLDKMEIEGIRKVTADQARNRTKLIAYADKSTAYVKPIPLAETDILSSINGVTNALEIDTDTLGKIYTIGPGAGKTQTAQAVLSDLVDILNS